MNTDDKRGQIITFYSYKGGTGRSMALANIACILAEQQAAAGNKGVLMIDWDLEAPGLHRYFGGRLAQSRIGISELVRRDPHNSAPGLIDLFYELDKQVSPSSTDASATNEQAARDAIGRVKLSEFILPTTISGLSLLKAGRFASQDPNEYSERVNKFNWEALFKKSPHLMRVFAETLAKEYAYVLIDSRTGITDISGITTMLLPEKLVVVFTPNLQSLKGGLELVRKATEYRKESVDLRPLTVFPLVSRVEANEPELRHNWRFGNPHTEGYQREFEKILTEVYGDRIKLNNYFDELQIQHIPRYAYGEEVAVLIEKTSDKFSLRRSYQSFATKLIQQQAPWEGEIEEGTAAERTEPFMVRFLKPFQRLWADPIPLLVLTSITLALALIPTYWRLQNTQASEQATQVQLQQARDQNQQLAKRVAELEEPIKGILAENESRIAQLAQQVTDVSKERDDAVAEAQKQRDLAAQSKQQADQNKARADRAVQALGQAQTTLTTVQADRDDSQRAYQDVLQKYVASQKEVRSLQGRLANCRTPP